MYIFCNTFQSHVFQAQYDFKHSMILCCIYSFSFQKEKLKSLLAAKEKQHEESLRTIEALKSRFKYFEVQKL